MTVSESPGPDQVGPGGWSHPAHTEDVDGTWQERSLADRERRIWELTDGLIRLRQILRLQGQLVAGSPADELIRRLLRE